MRDPRREFFDAAARPITEECFSFLVEYDGHISPCIVARVPCRPEIAGARLVVYDFHYYLKHTKQFVLREVSFTRDQYEDMKDTWNKVLRDEAQCLYEAEFFEGL